MFLFLIKRCSPVHSKIKTHFTKRRREQYPNSRKLHITVMPMQIAAVIFPSLVFPWRCFRGTISGNAFLPGSFHSQFYSTPNKPFSPPLLSRTPILDFVSFVEIIFTRMAYLGEVKTIFIFYFFLLTFSFSSFHSTFSHFLFFFSSRMSPFMLTPLEERIKEERKKCTDLMA